MTTYRVCCVGISMELTYGTAISNRFNVYIIEPTATRYPVLSGRISGMIKLRCNTLKRNTCLARIKSMTTAY